MRHRAGTELEIKLPYYRHLHTFLGPDMTVWGKTEMRTSSAQTERALLPLPAPIPLCCIILGEERDCHMRRRRRRQMRVVEPTTKHFPPHFLPLFRVARAFFAPKTVVVVGESARVVCPHPFSHGKEREEERENEHCDNGDI